MSMDDPESVRTENKTIEGKGIISATGILSITGNLIISGKYTGKLKVEGKLIIGPDARVIGEITANDLDLMGHLKGNILVINKVAFSSGSNFSGYIKAAKVEIHNGCIISGNHDFGSNSLTEPLESKKNRYREKTEATIPLMMDQSSFWFSTE